MAMNHTPPLDSAQKQPTLEELVRRARAAYPAWRSLSVPQRMRHLERLKRLIYARRRDIAAVLVKDSARVQFSAEGLIFEVLNTFGIARHAQQLLQQSTPIGLHPLWYRSKRSRLVIEPLGVVGVISPANSPFFESFQQLIQAVVMGNTVIIKPSERTPHVARLMADLLTAADLPAGVAAILEGGPEQGQALCQAPGVDKIVVYGTRETGQAVMRACAATVKPAVWGLGGNEAAIVLDDCPLEYAAAGIVYGAFCNAGQTCSCTRRVFALPSVATQLEKLLCRQAQTLRLAPLADELNEIGGLKKTGDAQALLAAVKEAQQAGARLLMGGEYDAVSGRLSPIILADVKPSMRIMREEYMGPYLCCMRVESVDQAIALANDSIFGLTASVWTADQRRGQQIAEQLQAGTVWINDTQFYHYELPYGGIKQSGNGKTCGREGLLEYVQRKLICAETGLTPHFHWFPYSEKKLRVMRAMLTVKHDPSALARWRAFWRLMRGAA